ncbi:sulfite dehydrogenase [Methylonatrum kenyense]|uniref:sulfite dehydrogenase n=1 Tax=Methylonatrum kenyense TaxID=455253 RepID=UPI0020C0467C|nr:sulfite dehydrogenase [Methylonatrum kenyense]MCK8517318.1 sulfite dehydrogenase [Methylonatrum kenyense]
MNDQETKAGVATRSAVEELEHPRDTPPNQSLIGVPEPSPQAPTEAADTDIASMERRGFLRRGAAVAGMALTGGLGGLSVAQASSKLAIPESMKRLGDPISETSYGKPISFEDHVVRRRSDVVVNRQNWSDWSMTPLQNQVGTITPNGLFFERHHAGIARIDPAEHRLAIHGLVERPLVFTMDELMRFPSVSRFHFMECSGNGLTDWDEAGSKTVQQSHGLLSSCQWTGIPFSVLLNEAGVKPEGKWVVLEGGDASGHLRSIPMEKIMDDAIVAYGQNGEMLRAEQGYPIRAFLPGWEGNTCVKWLRRIEVVDDAQHIRGETARYTDPMPGGKWRQFSMEMECKSVITYPSGGMRLNGAGYYQIRGFAWSGNGKITHVDVTFDGGVTWHEAKVEGPVLDKNLTRFTLDWKWDGRPVTMASRAVDDTGYVQPTTQQLAEQREIVGFVQHHNGVFPWIINEHGEVRNGIA